MAVTRTATGRRTCTQHGPGEMRVVGGKRHPRWQCDICYREYSRQRRATRKFSKPVEPGSTVRSQILLEARMSYTYEVVFTCAHANEFIQPAPRVGELFHCNYCGDWKRVVRVAEGRRRHTKPAPKSLGKTKT